MRVGDIEDVTYVMERDGLMVTGSKETDTIIFCGRVICECDRGHRELHISFRRQRQMCIRDSDSSTPRAPRASTSPRSSARSPRSSSRCGTQRRTTPASALQIQTLGIARRWPAIVAVPAITTRLKGQHRWQRLCRFHPCRMLITEGSEHARTRRQGRVRP